MLPRFVLAAAFATLVPASAFAGPTPARDNIDALIELQAKAHKVPADFVHRVVKRESNYNPRAKGGSALGLMQIKHATARGLGYRGEADGLYDPETNLKYGIAYLAGAYHTAKGDLDQAYRYYSRGYYYAAKKLGISNEVPEEGAAPVAPAATTATGFAGLFGPRTTPSGATVQTASADPNAPLAYAPQAAPAGAVEVPLPPRRPDALGGASATAPLVAGALSTSTQSTSAPVAQQITLAASAETVEVPLPPRRPSAAKLAAAAPRPDAARVEEAAAVAPAQ